MDTLICLVLDMTGSMDSCRDATISGVNEYMKSQAAQPGECEFSLALFNSDLWRFEPPKPVANFEPLTYETYVPANLTPLYDAVARAIRELEPTVAARDPKQVLFVVMTDGEENASREYTEAQVRTLVGEKMKHPTKPWQFAFLGANMDQWAMAQKIGGQALRAQAAAYRSTPIGTAAAFAALQRSTTAYRDVGAPMASEDKFWTTTPDDEEEGGGNVH